MSSPANTRKHPCEIIAELRRLGARCIAEALENAVGKSEVELAAEMKRTLQNAEGVASTGWYRPPPSVVSS